jgi:hypothetical protein
LTEHTKWTIEDEDSKYINIFDSNGNLAKALKYSSKDKLLSKVEYEYEDNILKAFVEESKFGKDTTRFEYDASDNPVKQTETNKAGEMNNQATRKYNKNNDVTETEVYINLHGRGPDQHYLLKYDYEYFSS